MNRKDTVIANDPEVKTWQPAAYLCGDIKIRPSYAVVVLNTPIEDERIFSYIARKGTDRLVSFLV